MTKPYLVFDMDGVLVDVSDSYRETIRRTVGHFTAELPSRDEIQQYKNAGGWNDDWQLSHEMIHRAGVSVAFEDVVSYFQTIFRGNGKDGLILRERWIALPGLMDRLAARFRLAVFTGREREEAEFTLKRFAPHLLFSPIIGMYEVERHKPHPDGLLEILKAEAGGKAWYIGDTVDDARCARAARVPFIGIAGPGIPLREKVVELFEAENAIAVLDDINGLESVLEQ